MEKNKYLMLKKPLKHKIKSKINLISMKNSLILNLFSLKKWPQKSPNSKILNEKSQLKKRDMIKQKIFKKNKINQNKN
jgi:hypothetical protein